MTEQVLVSCPVCSRQFPMTIDVPGIREMQPTCPFCVDLALEVILERAQPANPHGEPVVGDPEHWRLVGVAAQAPHSAEPTHHRRSRRQARRKRSK